MYPKRHRPKTEPSIAQKWAHERNAAKWRLKGIQAQLKSLRTSEVTTAQESTDIAIAEYTINKIIKNWPEESKKSKKLFIG